MYGPEYFPVYLTNPAPVRRDGCPCEISMRASALLEFSELINLHLALGEHSFNLQSASHGSDHRLQSADVHIGAALHL